MEHVLFFLSYKINVYKRTLCTTNLKHKNVSEEYGATCDYFATCCKINKNINFCLPDCYEIIDWFCLKDSKINIYPIPWWYSYKPETVLEVWIFIGIAWRVYRAIHSSYISSTKSCKNNNHHQGNNYMLVCHNIAAFWYNVLKNMLPQTIASRKQVPSWIYTTLEATLT